MPQRINLAEKLGAFSDLWSPKVVGSFNGHDLMVVKVKGEFNWHSHPDTDDLFLVLQGRLTIELRDGPNPREAVTLGPGELYVVPKGVEHRPVAEAETHLLLIEPRWHSQHRRSRHGGREGPHLTGKNHFPTASRRAADESAGIAAA
jgi:mannose-6-phosphate isomerase-like protein (cupin superfamily)